MWERRDLGRHLRADASWRRQSRPAIVVSN
jgi:hypothetical protein